jgi:hypothetical protein
VIRRLGSLAALAAALITSGCGTAARVTSTAPGAAVVSDVALPTTPASSSTRRTGPPDRASAANTRRRPRGSVLSVTAVASVFAGAYARYLDGQLPADALPDAGAGALSKIGPPIPRAARASELTVRPAQRAGRATFTVELRDRAHTFPVQLTVKQDAGRWLVTSIVAPDIDTILHSQSIPIPQPPGSAAAEQAARLFLVGYLRWLYGTGPAGAIPDATSRLIVQLKANPPNIPPTFQRLQGWLDSLGMHRADGGWRAFALVTDRLTSYNLVMSIQLVSGRWLVASVGPAG